MGRAKQVRRLTNQARRMHGLRPLRRSPLLNRSARRKAQDLAASGVLAHGRWAQLIDRITKRRFGTIGENIATRQDRAEQVVAQWLASPTHRANILNNEFRLIGVGYVQTDRGTEYWVQHFGG